MPEKEPPLVVNLDDIKVKRRLMSKIGTMKGLWEVSLRPRKKTRSLNANAYYWSAYVHPWTEWMRDEWGDPTITTEQAHIELKKAVLGTKELIKKDTGDVIELVPTTHDMDKDDFGIYLDKAAEFLASFAGIVVLPSEMFFEDRERRAS